MENIEADGVFGLGLTKNGSCLLLDNLAKNKLIEKKVFAFYFTSYIFASRIGGGLNFFISNFLIMTKTMMLH